MAGAAALACSGPGFPKTVLTKQAGHQSGNVIKEIEDDRILKN
jgi:hypothetical protein